MVTGAPRRMRAAAVVIATALAAACQASVAEQPVATPAATPPPAVVAARACAATTLDGMSRVERVGQLLVVGVPADDAVRATGWVRRYHLGGVLLTGQAELTVPRARKATDALHDAAGDGPVPLVAVDQEGGSNQTLRGTDFFDIPSAADQAEMSAREISSSTEAWADALHLAGVDLTLGPVADTVLTEDTDDNPIVGSTDRAYGDDPNLVAPRVDQVVKAIESQDVMATLRHFPGVGRLTADPATSDDTVDRQLTINDPQITPFVTGIEAGADVVLISAATYPRLGDDVPAVYSRTVVTGLLRDVIGFDGVALSDDLSESAAASRYPVAERGVRFVRAGGDLVLSVDSRTSRDLLDGMLAADGKDPRFRALVDAAAARVLALKAERGLLTC